MTISTDCENHAQHFVALLAAITAREHDQCRDCCNFRPERWQKNLTAKKSEYRH